MTPHPNDPKGEAGSKKVPLHLLPPYALALTALAHAEGAEKYGAWNWRQTGVCATTYIGAILRHVTAWQDGEDLDPDSGLSHLAKVAACCNILLDAAHCGTLVDDRSKVGVVAAEPMSYRLLKKGEQVTDGDEIKKLNADGWGPCCMEGYDDPVVVGVTLHCHEGHYRRKVQPFADVLDEAEVERCRKIYDELTAKYAVPDVLPPLPPVPDGYDRWEYRGMGWKSDCPKFYGCVTVGCKDWGENSHQWNRLGVPEGHRDFHYIEAVK